MSICAASFLLPRDSGMFIVRCHPKSSGSMCSNKDDSRQVGTERKLQRQLTVTCSSPIYLTRVCTRCVQSVFGKNRLVVSYTAYPTAVSVGVLCHVLWPNWSGISLLTAPSFCISWQARIWKINKFLHTVPGEATLLTLGLPVMC